MKNFLNLAKKTDFQKSPGSWVPQKLDPRRNTQRHIIIKLPNIKDKERILKAAKEKETVTYKEVPIRLAADFSKETLQARRGWKEVFEVIKAKTYIQDYSIQQKYQSYHSEWKGR